MKTYHEHMTGGGIDSYANFIGDTQDIKDFYVLLGKNRDSTILTKSNFDTALEMLGGESDKVQVHRFGHWACGWFKLILLHPDIKSKGEEIEQQLDNYPVLDESEYYERESEEVQRLWDYSLAERINYCKECGDSVFSARSDIPPDNVQELLSVYANE